MKTRFWGVRGSVASPLVAKQVQDKLFDAMNDYDSMRLTSPNRSMNYEEFLKQRPFWKRGTYGGNTSCVEVECGGRRIVLDMGTGVRLLGNSLFPEMMKNKGIELSFLLSHVHWDHIQGLPFFGPLYMNKETGIRNSWSFYGGTDWMRQIEPCLRGQMDPPNFPVSWPEIIKNTHQLKSDDLYDMKSFNIGDVLVRTRKLNHPQETYGWRIEYDHKVVVYTTDNEPFDPIFPDPKLLDLARDADLWVTDCQYTKDIYEGKVGGVPRHGWGHSYPEAVAQTAVMAGVKQVALFHHDPASSDEAIYNMEESVRKLILEKGGNSEVVAAHEGLEIVL